MGESRFQFLMREGVKVPGINNERMDQRPDWYDEDKYIKGRKVIRKYNIAALLSSTLGPIILSQYNHLMEPLVATGNLKTLEAAKNRVGNTFQHVLKWIDGDMFNPKDPAYQSLLKVRGIHHHIAKRLNESRPNREDGGVWLSQFEMTITLFSITGPVFIYPKEIGFYATDEELEAVAFVWRVIGRQLGMIDEFNLCRGTIQEIQQVCREIVEIAKPTLLAPKEEYTLLLRNSLTALKEFSLFVDYAALLNFTYELIGLELREPMTLYGKICLRAAKDNIKMMKIDKFRDLFTPWYKAKVVQWVSSYQEKRQKRPAVETKETYRPISLTA